jgi:hypothetical protein
MQTISARIQAVRGWVHANEDRATNAVVAALLAAFTVLSIWVPYSSGTSRAICMAVALAAAVGFAVQAAVPQFRERARTRLSRTGE